MKKHINTIAIIIELFILILGGCLVILTKNEIAINIGCSLIASAIVSILSTIFINFKKTYDVWDDWKLDKIYKKRSERNPDLDKKMQSHNIMQLDVIAFGLRSFRNLTTENDIIACLQKGMKARFLVMNPDGEFIKQREIEENVAIGSIAQSIKELTRWVNKMNQQSTKGKIEIKYYNAMTFDLYWRIDEEITVGPYLIGMESQQNLAYNYIKGGYGFQFYSDYFENLWQNDDICYYPTEFVKSNSSSRSRKKTRVKTNNGVSN